MKVKLDDVIEAMESANEEACYFYSVKDEKIILLFECMVEDEKNQELYEYIKEFGDDNYISLPDQYDIHEYSIMEDFIETVASQRKQNYLYNAIRGKKAFRRFKDAIYELGIENQWYKYRDKQYEKIAREWCEKYNIEIVEDK